MSDRFLRRGERVAIFDPVVILKPDVVSIGRDSRIDSFSKIEGGLGVTIGKWVHISSFAHINVGGGLVIIGDGVAITTGARVFGGSNTPDGYYMSSSAPMELQVVKRGITEIGEGAMIAANAVVLPGVRVGRFSVLAAGGVATKDIPDYEIWGGVPAQKIRTRTISDELRKLRESDGLSDT